MKRADELTPREQVIVDKVRESEKQLPDNTHDFKHMRHQYNKDEQIMRQSVLKVAGALTSGLTIPLDEKVEKTKEVAEKLLAWVKQ